MDSSPSETIRQPFIEHLNELRRRLFWVVIAVITSAGLAFSFNQQLLDIVQKPLHQTLYFTSPAGGLSFVFQLCLTVGFITAFPVIIYHIYQFLSPIVARQRKRRVFFYISMSFVLALGGLAFAYFISLPAALHFLTQFGGENVRSLIKADEYFSFALAYMAGFALMFQIPLLISIINRVKPMKPGRMMRAQRWVILSSFIGAAIITPTPDPINQTLMAAPAIVLYQISIILVWLVNKGRSQPEAVSQTNNSRAVPERPTASAVRRQVQPKVISDFVPGSYKRQPVNRQKPIIVPMQRRVTVRPVAANRSYPARPIRSIDGFIIASS